MKQSEALVELQTCKQILADMLELGMKGCFHDLNKRLVYFAAPKYKNDGWTWRVQYYQNRINQLKQKYFFVEQL